jgi:hypothetical protein
MAIAPKKGDALLFWDMHVDGKTVDRASLHASCPTIKGNYRPSKFLLLSRIPLLWKLLINTFLGDDIFSCVLWMGWAVHATSRRLKATCQGPGPLELPMMHGIPQSAPGRANVGAIGGGVGVAPGFWKDWCCSTGMHAGELASMCILPAGTKWTCTKWIHNKPYGAGFDALKQAAVCKDQSADCQ